MIHAIKSIPSLSTDTQTIIGNMPIGGSAQPSVPASGNARGRGRFPRHR